MSLLYSILADLKDRAVYQCERTSPWGRILIFIYGLFISWKALSGEFPIWNPLQFLDLGAHEIGHWITMPLGLGVSVPMGTVGQLAFPLIVGFALWKSQDFFGLSFLFAWYAESLSNVSQYCASAEEMGLVIGAIGSMDLYHDWNYMLSSLGLLSYDQSIASFIKLIAWCSFFCFLTSGIWLIWMNFRCRRSH